MFPDLYAFQPDPADIYDWSGHQLDPAARALVTVGNIVRIQVHHKTIFYAEAIYVQITHIDANDICTGTVLDTYRNFFPDETIYLPNGATFSFPRACITELPYTWEGNENLQVVANLTTGLGRTVTGMLPNPAASP